MADAQAALDGARAILVERFAEDADLIGELRERLWTQGRLASTVREGKETDGREVLGLLRLRRAVHEDAVAPDPRDVPRREGGRADADRRAVPAGVEADGPTEYEATIARKVGVENQGRPADKWLVETVRWAWRTKILVHLGIDLRMRLRQAAEDEAVRVFAANLRDLLLAAPAGTRATMGLDPGFRTGVKVAVVDATGKVVDTGVDLPARPAEPVGQVDRARWPRWPPRTRST